MTKNPEELTHIAKVKSKIGYIELVILLAFLMAINTFANEMLMPSYSALTQHLHILNPNDQQYIFFMYVVGLGYFQIFYGPISDRFGRKKPLIFGVICYGICAVLCTLTSNFLLFIILRLIQGAGAAATRGLIFSVISDLFEGTKMATTISLFFTIFILIAAAEPAIGQYLINIGSWKYAFAFMASASLCIGLWVAIRLPETLYEKRPLTFKTVKESFHIILTNRIALGYTLAVSVLFGGLLGCLTASAQIFLGIFSLGSALPMVFGAIYLAQVVASFLNAFWIKRYDIKRLSHSFLILHTLATLAWTVWAITHNGHIPLPLFLALFLTIIFCYGAVSCNFDSIAMEPLHKIAGTASASFGFLQNVIGGALGFLIAQHLNGTTQPIAIGYLLMSIIAIGFVLIAEKGKLFNSTKGLASATPLVEVK